jgi:hypothetical protein
MVSARTTAGIRKSEESRAEILRPSGPLAEEALVRLSEVTKMPNERQVGSDLSTQPLVARGGDAQPVLKRRSSFA